MLQGNDPWAVIESEVQSFRAGTVRFLKILIHFDRETLYAEKGYSSLFALLTERYGFSEGAAMRRINCCRAAQIYPPCLDHLADGSINVSTLSAIYRVMTAENGEALIKKVKGQSTDQVRAIVDALKNVTKQAEPLPLFASLSENSAPVLDNNPANIVAQSSAFALAQSVSPVNVIRDTADSLVAVTQCSEPSTVDFSHLSPAETNPANIIAQSLVAVTPPTKTPLPTSEQIEALTPATVAEPAKVIRFTGENLLLYRKAEQRFGHLREEHLINRVFTVALRSNLPRTSQKRAYNTATRYIPNHIRQEVLERDGHRCTFVSAEGHRCSEQCGLQLDHFVPFSQGGASTVENLRAMCPAHNQLLAERALGKGFMARKRKQG